jgi:hypothetical protein
MGVKVDDNRVVLDKLVTFRGDSEEAWARAEKFIERDLLAAASNAGDPQPRSSSRCSISSCSTSAAAPE